jgi:hypothetical protein
MSAAGKSSFIARVGLLEEPKCPVGVPQTSRLQRAGTLELIERVLANGLEHVVATLAITQQALLDQCIERVDVSAGDLLGALKRASAHEHAESGEHLLLAGGQQVVAPVEGCAQRALAIGHVPSPAPE